MKPEIAAPLAPERVKQCVIHGETMHDEYAWLRDRDDPEVLAYLKAENAYTAAAMARTADLQKTLFEEMRSRTPETDISAPVNDGPYAYYSRTEAGKDYRIRCRVRRGRTPGGAEEQVLLDCNQLAEGHDYLELGCFTISPDHRMLAYSADFDGGEKFELRVRDLDSGVDLPDRVAGTYYNVEWSGCGGFLFYVTLDEAMRPYRLWRHQLGSAAGEDVLVYEETDQAYHLEIAKSRSERFLILESASLTTSELRVLEADAPEGDFQVLLARKSMVEYSVDHQDDFWWLRINDRGRNFRLVRTACTAPLPPPDEWEEVIPHREDVCLEDMDCFAEFVVVSKRENGLPQLLVMDRAKGGEHRILFPESVYSASVGANAEYRTETLRIHYESPVSPPAEIDYGLRSRERVTIRQQQVFGGFRAEDYQVERLQVVAPDGVLVPLSVVSNRSMMRDGSAPCLLYGYGAYGLTVEAGFSPERLSLLERGFVFAIAHVRGGGDLGETWHDAGKMQNKPNSFRDFLACAERLIADGYTSARKLGILGRSAGGLLVAAAMNLRPELFGAVVASVPFVDVLNTMLDPSLPLTVGEYEEWGNPADPCFFRLLRSYSPYENVREADYPHVLVSAGFNDPRVSYWEPAKLVARLRRKSRGSGIILLKTELGAGHFGPSGRYEEWKEVAFEYAFLVATLGALKS